MKHKNGFAPIAVIIIVLLVASATVAGLKYKSFHRVGFQQDQSLVKSVVKSFCEDFTRVSPPALNDAGAVAAMKLLSTRAMKIAATKGPSPSATLVQFLGVYDVPEGGFTVDEAIVNGDLATVKSTWKYSSGPKIMTFDLVKENGSWKIDAVK